MSESLVERADIGPLTSKARINKAFEIRKKAAQTEKKLPVAEVHTNGDEEKYPSRIGNFSKALQHNEFGEPNLDSYNALIKALKSGKASDFDAIPLGGALKLENPQAGLAFELQGHDPHRVLLPPPPTFDSAETAGEMVELYWMALLRDVPYLEYESHPLAQEAIAELSALSDFRGPTVNGQVTGQTLFRGTTSGETVGPYISQLLFKNFQYGAISMQQKIRVPQPNLDYLTEYPEWLGVQNGMVSRRDTFLPAPRFIVTGRDASEYVHNDPLYQSIYHAALILLGMRTARDAGNPYLKYKTTQPFSTFGGPFVLGLLASVMTRALNAVWYNKWFVHRRLRPEEFGGRVHRHLTQAPTYPIHSDVLNSKAAETIFSQYGTYLLPQAFPEGCPTHPAYGAGHAAFAAAGATILKAFFDEDFVILDPVIPNEDGTELVPYRGPDLTVGGELNKLVANIGISRNMAGVHWRTDADPRLGEEVAIAVLGELREAGCYVEEFSGFSLTKFDGTKVIV
ncbi:MAG: vanadium-dependent haloperoxidase [Acidobacteria bacterium]|nr:vanadium-dependent haloperoxidase [Acidobacteriota bacterium]